MTRIHFTNGRSIYATVVDDSDPEVVIATNLRGRRLWLFRRLITAIV